MGKSVVKYPTGCKIVNIRRGKGFRKKRIYAELRDPDGGLIISATLDYIVERLTTHLEERDEQLHLRKS